MPPNEPLVSVVIPALNAEATLGELLAALAHQPGVPGQCEVIVVDNGSTDGTARVARARGAAVLHEPRPGVGAARAAGLAAARGRIVVNTDADTIPSRRWLGALVRALDDPDALISTGPVIGWQPTSGAERFTEARGTFGRAFTVDHPDFPHAKGLSMAFRRDEALAAGGWDPAMPCAEDADLSIRMLRRFGRSLRYVDQAVLFHRHRQSDEALWRQARWYGEGYSRLHWRYPDLVRWRAWKKAWVGACLGCLHAAAPLVAAGKAVGLVSGSRAEFEWYHRKWQRHFWNGFFATMRAGNA